MDVDDIGAVAIVGAGTMGSGIAQVFLGGGYDVVLHDSVPEALETASVRIERGLCKWEERGRLEDAASAFARLEVSPAVESLAGVDWVVEAIVERVEVKTALFARLGEVCRPDAVLCSNTSSISITLLGAANGRPGRVLGMHFFNPAPVMELVEIIPGLETDEAPVQAAMALAEKLGKSPVRTPDRPGFLANRLLMPLLNEAMFALMEGAGSAEEIDRVCRLGLNHPMGALALADLIGLDVCLDISEVLYRETGEPRFRPCPLLRKQVEAGRLGRKSGRGFHDYSTGTAE